MPLFSFLKGENSPFSPIISTRDGKLLGKRLIDEADFKADAFLGIPFAQPPVGDLRFRKPVGPNKWTDVRKCIEHPKRCIQVPSDLPMSDKDWPMSEDCLYLNVFCPAEYNEAKHPVMVWIHGGAYAMGSAKAYGDKGICDGLVRQGVIVVVVQYRLGMLGFLSTGDDVCPGNNGLWDQIEALKWVQENVEKFGGDKDNVTVFGQSAGGSSAHLLSLSPHSKGLMHRLILMSGNAHSPWGSKPSSAAFCRQYVEEKLGVKANTSQELVDALRRLPAERLATAYDPVMARKHCNLGFCPVIDGDILPDHVTELEKTAPALPILTGVTSLESGLSVAESSNNPTDMRERLDAMLPKDVSDETRESLIEMYREIGQRVQPKHAVWRAIAELASDRSFNISTVQTLKNSISRGIPAYFYVVEYYNAKSMGAFAEMAPSKDASHSTDLPFVFKTGIAAAAFSFCDHDNQVANTTIKAFTNFAKRGNPNDEGDSAWQPCDSEHPNRHMVIDLKPRIEEEFKERRCDRWIELLKTK